jgi:hypothetical protein
MVQRHHHREASRVRVGLVRRPPVKHCKHERADSARSAAVRFFRCRTGAGNYRPRGLCADRSGTGCHRRHVDKKDLKDPDSASFGDDWKAWLVTHPPSEPPKVSYHPENGDKLYSAGGSVNAKNGFGGYVGFQPYGCDASVTTGGQVQSIAYSLQDILNPTTPEATP